MLRFQSSTMIVQKRSRNRNTDIVSPVREYIRWRVHSSKFVSCETAIIMVPIPIVLMSTVATCWTCSFWTTYDKKRNIFSAVPSFNYCSIDNCIHFVLGQIVLVTPNAYVLSFKREVHIVSISHNHHFRFLPLIDTDVKCQNCSLEFESPGYFCMRCGLLRYSQAHNRSMTKQAVATFIRARSSGNMLFDDAKVWPQCTGCGRAFVWGAHATEVRGFSRLLNMFRQTEDDATDEYVPCTTWFKSEDSDDTDSDWCTWTEEQQTRFDKVPFINYVTRDPDL